MKIKLPNATIITREAKWTDYNYCYRLARRNMFPYYQKHTIEWSPKNYRENFNIHNITIIELNNRRIGFFKFEIRQDNWYLADLQISRYQRGKGIGKYVMSYIESIATKNTNNLIRLSVFIDNPAVEFYKKIGYKIIENKNSKYLLEKKFKIN